MFGKAHADIALASGIYFGQCEFLDFWDLGCPIEWREIASHAQVQSGGGVNPEHPECDVVVLLHGRDTLVDFDAIVLDPEWHRKGRCLEKEHDLGHLQNFFEQNLHALRCGGPGLGKSEEHDEPPSDNEQ